MRNIKHLYTEYTFTRVSIRATHWTRWHTGASIQNKESCVKTFAIYAPWLWRKEARLAALSQIFNMQRRAVI